MSHPHVIIDGTRVPIVSGGDGEGDAPDAGAADTGGDLGGAATSMSDRLEAAFGAESDYVDPDLAEPGEATGGEPPAPAEATAADDDQPMSLKEARALRAEQKAYREKWGGFEQAFSGMSEGGQALARAALPLVARGNADVAYVLGEYDGLHPDDQALIDGNLEGIAANPQAAALWFADVAGQLRGNAPDGEDEPDAGDLERAGDDADLLDPSNFLTPEDFDARMQMFLQAYQAQQAEAVEVQGMLAQLGELGYDLESDDLHEQARVESLFALARRLDGDIGKAHEALTGQRQATVDEYVSGKVADADRPQPPTAGAPSSGERRLEGTLEEGEAGMRARLDATFGSR